MSIQFKVARIAVTTGPAHMVLHSGEKTINPDFPVGTVLAYDKKDNLYYCVEESVASIWREDLGGRDTGKQITLYRDYWNYICVGADTPYGASIRNAEQTVIEGAGAKK